MVRVRSARAHAPWPNQTKADYPAVALWLFTRDYRAYREGVPDAKKPSLLGILTSPDFLAFFSNCLDCGYKTFKITLEEGPSGSKPLLHERGHSATARLKETVSVK